MYNDETPQGPTSYYRGHAKGVLAFAAPSHEVCLFVTHNVAAHQSSERTTHQQAVAGANRGFMDRTAFAIDLPLMLMSVSVPIRLQHIPLFMR